MPQIVEFARENNFEYIAITDHNNFQSVGVLKEMTDELPHKIAGIELSTKHNGKSSICSDISMLTAILTAKNLLL